MASVKQLILDDLVSSIENILVANNYNTNIQKVIAGKVLPVEKLQEWRSAVCQIKFLSQTNERTHLHFFADARYLCYAAMSNATSSQFLAFLDDVEASVSKDPGRGDLRNDAYNVLDTYVESITIITGEEFDEVLDDTSERLKEQEAILTIVVRYTYVPDLLSG